MIIALKLLAGVSSGSVKPNIADWKVRDAFSLTVTTLSDPAGALLISDTLKVKVFAATDSLLPPFSTPPLSRTRKVKLETFTPGATPGV